MTTPDTPSPAGAEQHEDQPITWVLKEISVIPGNHSFWAASFEIAPTAAITEQKRDAMYRAICEVTRDGGKKELDWNTAKNVIQHLSRIGENSTSERQWFQGQAEKWLAFMNSSEMQATVLAYIDFEEKRKHLNDKKRQSGIMI